MSNVKISELPQATSVGTSDIVPIVQSGTTKQATAGMIAPTIATSISSSSTNDEVAGAKAVYDLHDSFSAIKLNLSTTEAFATGNAWQLHKVPLNTEVFNYGNDFTYDSTNKCVTVGSNVSFVEISWCITIAPAEGVTNLNSSTVGRVTKDITNLSTIIPPAGNLNILSGKTVSFSCTNITEVTAGDKIALAIQLEVATSYRLIADRCTLVVKAIKHNTTSATRSLNTSLTNTGSLVGMGDRTEVTDETLEKTKLDEVADKDVGEIEVKEVTPLETTEEKTEGSGDVL